MIYDTIIIGGGPAAAAAAVYAGRKQMRTLLVTKDFGGQSVVSDDIQNWIGEPHISGVELAQKLEKHVRAMAESVEIKIGETVSVVDKIASVENRPHDFVVRTLKGEYEAKTVIVASGARRRQMGVPGEDKFNGKGVAYCSTCDAPLFKNKAVAVVGGGNAGLEAVIDLLPYATQIYLCERGSAPKGDKVTLEKIVANNKVKILTNVAVQEVTGEQFVSGLKIVNTSTNSEQVLPVQGVFVEIGSVPNSEMVKNLAETDKFGQIIINSRDATTSCLGLFAAGDVTDDPFKQNNISAGDGVRAALSAYAYVQQVAKANPVHEPE